MRLLDGSTTNAPSRAHEAGRWIADHGPEVIEHLSHPTNVVTWAVILVATAIMVACFAKAVIGAGRWAWVALHGGPGGITLGIRWEKLLHRITAPPVTIDHEDARRGGIQIVGPPGQGKSTLLAKALLQALYLGHTVIVLEIDGDLTERLLEYARAIGLSRRTFRFDASDPTAMKWNPLAGDPERVVRQAVDTVASVSAGHEFYSDLREDVLRHMTMLACVYAGHAGREADLRLLLWLLSDQDGAERVLKVSRDGAGNARVGATFVTVELRVWLEQEFLAWSRRERREYLVGLRNVLRKLLSSEQVVDALCPREGERAIDLRGALESGGLVVFRASSDAVGGVAARTVLTWALQRLQQETLGRKVPMRPVHAVLDEAHDLLGHRSTAAAESYAGWYAQCRKFNVVPWLGYQSFYQLPDVLRRALDASARHKIVFGGLHGDDVLHAQTVLGHTQRQRTEVRETASGSFLAPPQRQTVSRTVEEPYLSLRELEDLSLGYCVYRGVSGEWQMPPVVVRVTEPPPPDKIRKRAPGAPPREEDERGGRAR